MADPVTVTAKIFFQGLLLFVPHGHEMPGRLDVLLPDARRPPIASDGCPILPHQPWLLFAIDTPDQCSDDACEVYQGICRCPLDGVELKLDFQPGILPDERADYVAEALSEVPKLPVTNSLRDINARRPRGTVRLDCRPSCMSLDVLGHSPPPPLLVANMHVKVDQEISVCDPEARREFEFKPADQPRYLVPIEQVAVDRLAVKTTLQAAGLDGSRVRIRLLALDGTASHEILAPTVGCRESAKLCVDLAIVNDPDFDHFPPQVGRCSPKFIGRHLELLYDLLVWPRVNVERPVPHDLRGEGSWEVQRAARAKQDPPLEDPCRNRPRGLCCTPRLQHVLGAHSHRKAEEKPLCTTAQAGSAPIP